MPRPTASSNRLLNGALLGSCSTFSAFTPHCGHRTRYSSSTTVVWYSKHAKSRTSRSYTSQISPTRRPQLEHTTFWLPDLRRTHSFSALAAFVDLRSVDAVTRPPQNLRPVVVSHTAESIEKPRSLKPPSIALSAKFLRRTRLFSLRRREGFGEAIATDPPLRDPVDQVAESPAGEDRGRYQPPAQ